MSDEIPPLLDEDYEEAREAARKLLKGSDREPTTELIETLAKHCADQGRRTFRLFKRLDPPRHEFERLSLHMLDGELSPEKHKEKWRELAEQPVNQETLRAYIEDSEESLVWYSKLLQLPFLRNLDEREIDRRAGRYIVELRRKTSLPPRQLQLIAEFLEEARIEKQLGRATIGEYSASYAGRLVALVTDRAIQAWESATGIAYRSQTELNYLYATTAAALFAETWIPKLPSPNDLMSMLREEFAIGRIVLQQRLSSANAEPDSQIAVQDDTASSLPDGESRSRSQSKKAGTKAPKLRNWAVGMETKGNWWLFKRQKDKWEQRRKVDVQAGSPEALLYLLADQEGTMTMGEAIDEIREFIRQPDPSKFPDSVSHALKKARSAIKDAIAAACKCDAEDIEDPIPNFKPGWKTAIEVGFAVFEDPDNVDEKAKLTFKLKHQISS